MTEESETSPQTRPIRINTPASTIFDPLGRHHLSYARPPREKTFRELLTAAKKRFYLLLEHVGGPKRVFLAVGVGLMLLGAMAPSPLLAAPMMIVGLAIIESVVIAWGRGL